LHVVSELFPGSLYTVPPTLPAFTPNQTGHRDHQIPEMGSPGVPNLQFHTLLLKVHPDFKTLDVYFHDLDPCSVGLPDQRLRGKVRDPGLDNGRRLGHRVTSQAGGAQRAKTSVIHPFCHAIMMGACAAAVLAERV